MSNKLDYDKIEVELKSINKLVELCSPETKVKCFELLFDLAFNPIKVTKPTLAGSQKVDPEIADESEQQPDKGNAGPSFKLPGNVLSFLRKSNLTQADLEKLFILDHQPILPTYKIKNEKTSQAQLQKVLMILLENAILYNNFKASYVEVRDTCKEEGLFDGNFNKVLKNNHQLFKGAIKKDKIVEADSIELTGNGVEKLAQVVKEIGGIYEG